MQRNVRSLLDLYNPNNPLEQASTIPSPWYFDAGIADLENSAVFGKTWQAVGRADQVQAPGQFLTADIAGEPIVVVRGEDSSSAPSIMSAASCRRRGHRSARLRETVSLPLSRLDLRHRWRAERHG